MYSVIRVDSTPTGLQRGRASTMGAQDETSYPSPFSSHRSDGVRSRPRNLPRPSKSSAKKEPSPPAIRVEESSEFANSSSSLLSNGAPQ